MTDAPTALLDQETDVATTTKPKRKAATATALPSGICAFPPGNAVMVTFDADNVERWFANSNVESLRKWKGSEAELISEALKLEPSYSLEELIREGSRLIAKRLISIARTEKRATAPRGVKGQADKRLAAAFKKLIRESDSARKRGEAVSEITPYYLADAAETGSRTAKQWLERHHPELLVEKLGR